MKNIITMTTAVLFLFSFQPVRYVSGAGKTELTGAFLAGTKWGPEHQGGKHVNFKAGGVYDGWEDHIQSGEPVKGTYIIAGGTLSLVSDANAPYLAGGVPGEDPLSLRYTRYLQFGGGVKLWDLNSRGPAGRSISIGGVKAVTMAMRKGEITKNAKFRTGPSPTAKEMSFERFKESGEMDTEKIAFLPAKTPIVILARTERKVRVQQWENYWFYVEAEEPIDQWKQGWVFAEFIKVE
jgi:hypothetical protein